jgi:uncharacterized damage-inducible protein DinB
MSKRSVLLAALESAPGDMRRLVQAADEASAHRRPSPDEWSLAEVLAHLVDVEGRYLARLKRVVDEDCPHVPSIHPDETVYEPAVPPGELLAQFGQCRDETLVYLRRLSAGDWQRKAVHETWGIVSLRSLVQALVDHDTNHLQQAAAVRGRLDF